MCAPSTRASLAQGLQRGRVPARQAARMLQASHVLGPAGLACCGQLLYRVFHVRGSEVGRAGRGCGGGGGGGGVGEHDVCSFHHCMALSVSLSLSITLSLSFYVTRSYTLSM